MRDDPPVPVVFTAVANRLGYDVSLADVEAVVPAAYEFYDAQYLRDGDFWCAHERAVQLWLDMYAIIARHCGINAGVPELSQAVYDEYLKPECWSLFPDAEECLKRLVKGGFRLAVVSNWDATLESLLRKMGVLPYFDEVVASAAVGCRKPSSAIFEIALERMGVDPANAWHVGDLPEADGDGASGAGISPVIIDRKGIIDETCVYPRITTLADLPAYLGL